jgi:NADH-quinone oxidoreductase subunit F
MKDLSTVLRKCWHTTDKPCEQFIQCCTEGPFHHDEKCKNAIIMRKQLKMKSDKPIIIIGMGTYGLAAGAAKVKEAIEAELKN